MIRQDTTQQVAHVTKPTLLRPNLGHVCAMCSDFSENMLTGTIPSTYTFYITWLNKNSLVGTIPDVFAGVDILQLCVLRLNQGAQSIQSM